MKNFDAKDENFWRDVIGDSCRIAHRGGSSEPDTSRHTTPENLAVGGRIILPFLRAYASY
jgi:hypothetical protein